MSCKWISGSQPGFNLPPKPLQSTSTKSNLQLSFNTHLSKSNISIKTSYGSYRTRTMAAINNLYATTETTESFYELLGIPESGTYPEIKRAYKQLALKYHADVSPPGRTEEYTRMFIRVQEAYQTLSDPQSRALYDRDMCKGLNRRRSGERGAWRNRWESQLTELRRRSMNKEDSRGNNNVSWGARIRRQRK